MIGLVSAVVLLVFDTVRNLEKIKNLRWLRELRLETSQKTVLLLSLLWTSLYLVFLFFWLPQNTFYRLFYLPGLIILFGLRLASFKSRTGKSRRFTAALVVAVALANFLFLIYPFSHVQKYPPLAFALEMNREWPTGTVVYYAAQNSDEDLIRYFNPSTRWQLLRAESLNALETEIVNIYSNGGTAWLETTAFDQLSATAEGTRWLETHARKESSRELNDKAYKIRFVQIAP